MSFMLFGIIFTAPAAPKFGKGKENSSVNVEHKMTLIDKLYGKKKRFSPWIPNPLSSFLLYAIL